MWSAAKGWQGPAPNEEEEITVAKQHGLAPSRHAIYQSFGAGGVDFPALIRRFARTSVRRLDQPRFQRC